MNTILVVDDMAIFRDPIAASLRLAGYKAISACNGQDALGKLKAERPDLILLDVSMPVMDGITFLKHMRAERDTADIPVILLTAVTEKDCVRQAGKLGVREYMLKSRFSLKELIERMNKHMTAAAPTLSVKVAAPAPSVTPGPVPAVATARSSAKAPAKPSAPARAVGPVDIPRLLTRDECVQRTESALQAKTLSGVVAQVMSLAASPRGDTSELATLVSRDPSLSVKVLQAANSAAYVSTRGAVTTVHDAIRQVGCSTIRNIAAATGIFEAMPESGADGFNPIRCWQHSFAVAQLCQQLTALSDEAGAGLAYVVGLCHDLGEIVFRTRFASEYRQVLELHAQTGKPIADLEREMLGMTHGDLLVTILRQIGLPDTIRGPIESLHASKATGRNNAPLARVLQMADMYANGALLASSGHSLVAPLTNPEWRAGVGKADPPAVDVDQLRCDIYGITGMLARLKDGEEASMMAPPYPRKEVRVWLARHSGYSAFDPIAAAISSLSTADIQDHLPKVDELTDHRAIVVVSPASATAGYSLGEIRKASKTKDGQSLPVLWLTGRIESDTPQSPELTPITWPLPVERLAQFVEPL